MHFLILKKDGVLNPDRLNTVSGDQKRICFRKELMHYYFIKQRVMYFFSCELAGFLRDPGSQ
jgi:hypothetical protein